MMLPIIPWFPVFFKALPWLLAGQGKRGSSAAEWLLGVGPSALKSNAYMEAPSMSFNFAKPAPAAPVAAPANTAQERVKAQVYLNVGMTIPMLQEDGSTADVFVSLPIGIAVDTMEEMVMKGSNQNWNQMVQAKNWLLTQIQEAGTSLKPGQEETVAGLELQIKRVGQAVAPVAGENPYLAAMSSRLKLVS